MRAPEEIFFVEESAEEGYEARVFWDSPSIMEKRV